MANNFDYETERANLQRQQMLVDALMQRSMQPQQPQFIQNGAGTFYTGPGVLGTLAQTIGGAMAANNRQKDIDAKTAALKEQYNTGLKEGMDQYFQVRDGVPPPSAEVGGGPAMPGDPRRAAVEAVVSNYPQLQELGKMDLAAMAKKNQETFSNPVTEKGPDGSLISVQYGNQGSRRVVQGAIPFEKPMAVADRVIDPSAPTRPLADYSTKGGETLNIGGDLYQRDSNGTLHKLDNAPKTNISVNNSSVNKGESEFMKKVGTEAADDYIKAKQAKVAAQRTIQSMDKLEQLDKQNKLYTGPLANVAMQAGTLAESLGMNVDKQRLASSQAYQGELMAQMTQYLTGSLARSTTDKDMEILMAPMPQLLASPEGRAALRRQIKAKAQEHIEYADQVQKNVANRYPEAGNFFSITPGNVPVPQRSDTSSQPGVRKYNPATGKIE